MLGGQRHLAHQMRRHEYGASLALEILEQISDPVDAFRIEAVHGLVEHHRLGIAEERVGALPGVAEPPRWGPAGGPREKAAPPPNAARKLSRPLLRPPARPYDSQ